MVLLVYLVCAPDEEEGNVDDGGFDVRSFFLRLQSIGLFVSPFFS